MIDAMIDGYELLTGQKGFSSECPRWVRVHHSVRFRHSPFDHAGGVYLCVSEAVVL